MSNSVLDAAFHLVHDAPGGAVALAPRIGKNPATLSHELTASGTAKFALVDAVKLTMLTGDLRILNAFAGAAGCVVLPSPHHALGIGAFEQLAGTAKEFGEFVTSVAESVRDGRVTANELARVDAELAELIQAGQEVRATLAAMHEASKPSHIRRAA
jgi:hypothetical protein